MNDDVMMLDNVAGQLAVNGPFLNHKSVLDNNLTKFVAVNGEQDAENGL